MYRGTMEAAKGSRSGSGTADSLKPPPPKRRKKEAARDDSGTTPSSWHDLGPELIGLVARFLRMGNSDLMNLLLCLGPRTAALVRKAYLQGNDYYLSCCFGRGAGADFRYWLKYNEDEWKERSHGVESGSRVHSVSLTSGQARMINLRRSNAFIRCLLNLRRMGVGATAKKLKYLQRYRRPFLLAIGNTKLIPTCNTGTDDVRSLFEKEKPDKDGKIVLHFIRYVDYVFVHPVLSIHFGLTNVLKYLLDEGLVGVNDRYPAQSGALLAFTVPCLCFTR